LAEPASGDVKNCSNNRLNRYPQRERNDGSASNSAPVHSAHRSAGGATMLRGTSWLVISLADIHVVVGPKAAGPTAPMVFY
jgi:hypothetical protein